MKLSPEKLQEYTNEVICYHCGKFIDHKNERYYEIQCLKDFKLIFSLKTKDSGRGAILRFHEKCFEIIAGDEFMFNKKEWGED